VDDAVAADHGVPPDRRVRVNGRAAADASTFADHRERANRCVGGDLGVRVHEGLRVNAGGRPPRVGEQLHRPGKCQIRLRRPEHRARRRLGVLPEDDRGGAGHPQLRRVLGIGKEGQVARPRLLDSCDPPDVDFAVAIEAAIEAGCNVSELQPRKYIAPRQGATAGRLKTAVRLKKVAR
jgi:hypothetical protein